MKKIIALVLALVMVLSLATTAFAASAGTITFKKGAKIGETAANIAARSLQIPALLLGNAMDLNQRAVVNTLNVMGPVVYNGAQIAANLLDNAVAVSGKVAQVRITLVGGTAAAAMNGTAKMLNSVGNSEKNDDLVKMAADLRQAGSNITAVVDYSNNAIEKVTAAVDKAVASVFSDQIALILRKMFRYKEQPGAELLMEEDSIEARFDEVKLTSAEPEKICAVSRIFKMIDLVAGDLTLEQLLVPGEWEDVKEYKGQIKATRAYFPAEELVTVWEREKYTVSPVVQKWRETIPSGMSYLAAMVNEVIDVASAELKDASNFAAMNGSYAGTFNHRDITPYWNNPGGEVAEFLFRVGYNLLKEDGSLPWDGTLPSWEGNTPGGISDQA